MPSPAPADADDTPVRALAAHAETAIARGGHATLKYAHAQREDPSEASGTGVILLFDILGCGQFEIRITAPSPVPGPCKDLDELVSARLVSELLAAATDRIEDALENAGMEVTGRTAQDGQPSLTVDATPHGRFAMLIGDRTA